MIKIFHKDIVDIQTIYVDRMRTQILDRIKGVRDVCELIERRKALSLKDIKLYGQSPALAALRSDKASKTKPELLTKLNTMRRNRQSWATRMGIFDRIEKYLDHPRLTAILSESPQTLLTLQQKALKAFRCNKSDTLIKFLFDYGYFYHRGISQIAKDLGIQVCPYCNRLYITHIEDPTGERLVGPTFDHFFSKEVNPVLAVSFYNLIPSCTLCNTNRKGQKQFALRTHLHPYLFEFGVDATFDFDLGILPVPVKKGIKFIPKIKVNAAFASDSYYRLKGDGTKDSGSLNVFRLEEIYQTHADVIEELHEKFDENSIYYSDSIKPFLEGLKTNEAEFYRFHFRNYFDPVNFLSRPLSKMTRDIYDKMKAIYLLTKSYSTK